MSKIIDEAIGCTFWAIGTIIIAPIVVAISLVAIPIFSVKAVSTWIGHRALYNRTLTNLTREKYGRIAGQDYTRWDGKSLKQINKNPTKNERMHASLGMYFHGAKDSSFKYKPIEGTLDSPFETQEDAEWLRREYVRREKKDLLDSDLRMLRAFAKALIPILGVIWVIYTELGLGGASEIGCRVCSLGNSANGHWDWRESIEFHQASLRGRLKRKGT